MAKNSGKRDEIKGLAVRLFGDSSQGGSVEVNG